MKDVNSGFSERSGAERRAERGVFSKTYESESESESENENENESEGKSGSGWVRSG